ncbi:hypothetical protein ACJX0J_029523, partial [Zea mays]
SSPHRAVSAPPGDPAPCCVRSIFLRRHTQRRCEGMSTYPRTYDLIHADSVFTLYRNREKILLVVKTYWTTHEAMTKISSRTVNTCSDRKFNMWGEGR